MILSGNTLYGSAAGGGSAGNGTVFTVHTDGTGFTTLHTFTAVSVTNSEGAGPGAGLILSSNTLYGTTSHGGSWDSGTVFSLFIRPQLDIVRSGTNAVLTWPTNAVGFTLQSATNLLSPADWNTVSPGPVLVNGQNVVTNPISSTKKFYRLVQ